MPARGVAVIAARLLTILSLLSITSMPKSLSSGMPIERAASTAESPTPPKPEIAMLDVGEG